jgi:hypothetical protein
VGEVILVPVLALTIGSLKHMGNFFRARFGGGWVSANFGKKTAVTR